MLSCCCLLRIDRLRNDLGLHNLWLRNVLLHGHSPIGVIVLCRTVHIDCRQDLHTKASSPTDAWVNKKSAYAVAVSVVVEAQLLLVKAKGDAASGTVSNQDSASRLPRDADAEKDSTADCATY